MNISYVVKSGYCLGCGLCVSDVGKDRLKMVEHKNGFIFPEKQNGFDGEIDLLDKYCPGITLQLKRPLPTKKEKLYGPVIKLETCFANDPEIRFRGSSGGCLTAILCALIEQKKVDGILHIGGSKNSPTKTESYFSRTTEEIIANAGSRYAPSSLLYNFKQIIEQNNRIAIVGKPCDIAGVSQFIDCHPKYSHKIYCKLSFLCMGLPSQNATNRLIKELGIEEPDQVQDLRYRGRGWPGEVSVIGQNGKSYSCSYNDSWGKILGRDLLFRCKICPDGWGCFADISSGDAWYTDGNEPIFEEKPGRSLLFVRTPIGQEVIHAIRESITISEYNVNELPIIQKPQHARKYRIWLFYLILKLFGDRLLKFKGLGIWNQIFKSSPILIVKDIRGFIKRLPKT